MLPEPKEIKYWINDIKGSQIDAKAPAWAKEEFEAYQRLMSAKPNKKGTIKWY